jgi:carbamoyltransferase
LGAALAANYGFLGQQRAVDPAIADAMAGSYLGPSYQQDEIEASLKESGAKFEVLSDSELIKNTADSLAAGKAIGWFQGRMEYGPRALGNRSILGDPRSEDMQKSLNLKVKYRESFRPFAPAIRAEDVGDWFELDQPSPYMLFVDQVAKQHCRTLSEGDEARQGLDRLNVPRSDIPAVTHVDFSARIQTVHKETNPRFYDLLTAFNDRTGCPVLVNTSFNVRGEPIVGTPEDAFRCFMGTEIEILSIGNCFLRKEEQDPALKRDYSTAFDLD